MAWTNFQRSNWSRVVGPQHAVQVFTSVAAGITITAASTQLITLTSAAYQFKGNGEIDVFFPEGLSDAETAATQGMMLGNAWLQGPASGSYSAGNHPQIVFQVSSQKLMTVASGGFTIIAMQS